ncbi:hypothetical protein HY988_03665 [Candidatus Micrarchaeota archaeon]|nr:hypothetical protein [Candidatus Micrarchaeota archaeon]
MAEPRTQENARAKDLTQNQCRGRVRSHNHTGQEGLSVRDEGRQKILFLIDCTPNPVEVSKLMDAWVATHPDPDAAAHVAELQKADKLLALLKIRADSGDKTAQTEITKILSMSSSLTGKAKESFDSLARKNLGENYLDKYSNPVQDNLFALQQQQNLDLSTLQFQENQPLPSTPQESQFDSIAIPIPNDLSNGDLSNFVFMRDVDFKANGNSYAGQTSIEKATFEQTIEIDRAQNPAPGQNNQNNLSDGQSEAQSQDAAPILIKTSSGVGLFGKYLFEDPRLMPLKVDSTVSGSNDEEDEQDEGDAALKPISSKSLTAAEQNVAKKPSLRLIFGNLSSTISTINADRSSKDPPPSPSDAGTAAVITKPKKQRKIKNSSPKRAAPSKVKLKTKLETGLGPEVKSMKSMKIKTKKSEKISQKLAVQKIIREKKARTLIPKKDASKGASPRPVLSPSEAPAPTELSKTKSKALYSWRKTKRGKNIGKVNELIKSIKPASSRSPTSKKDQSKKPQTTAKLSDKEKEKQKLKNILALILSKRDNKKKKAGKRR